MAKNTKTNKVIILKGSPGIGKSYTARKLISQLSNKKIALISVDEILHIDQRNLTEDKLKLAKFHAAILTRSFIQEDFDVIIEYTFDIPDHLKFMIDKIKRSHVEKMPNSSIHIFHFTAKLEEVIKRNKTRRDGSDPLPTNVLKKLYDSCENTAGKGEGEIIIQTNKVSVEKIVNQILKTIL